MARLFHRRIAAEIRRAGMPATFRRITSTGGPSPVRTVSEHALHVVVTGYGEQPAPGSLIQSGDQRVTLAAAALPFRPEVSDKIVIDWIPYSIVAVTAFSAFGEVARYELQVRR